MTLALVLIGAISLGVYFLANQLKQNDSNKGELTQVSPTQLSNVSLNFENVNAPKTSNANPDTQTPTPIPTPDKTQLLTVMNRYAANAIKRLKPFCYDTGCKLESKKTLYGDQDAAVMFHFDIIMGTGMYDELAIFTNTDGQFSYTTNKEFREENVRNVELTAIKSGKVYVKTMSLSDKDSRCCPSIEGRREYLLSGNRLTEFKK